MAAGLKVAMDSQGASLPNRGTKKTEGESF